MAFSSASAHFEGEFVAADTRAVTIGQRRADANPHPNLLTTCDTDNPSAITANTAAYLCSATLNSLIQGVSRYISRNPVRHHPKTQCQTSPDVIHKNEWGGRGSNPRPTDYESAALTN